MFHPSLHKIPASIDVLEPRVMLTGSSDDGPGMGQPSVLSLDDSRSLTDIHRLTGVDIAHDAGLTGAGQTVVVIDSGVAYDHPALGGGLGQSYRVVGGWDFTEENDADPYDDGPAGYHGTHVTGILASQDPVHAGVAPEVDIVALRVFNDYGRGKMSWLESSLQWVLDHQNTFEHPITTVNLSIGTAWHSIDLPDYAELEDEFQALWEANIFVSVAAGNRFDGSDQDADHAGLSYPAASPWVVSAASSNAQGQLSEFSQRLPSSLAVPGESIVSTVPDFLEDFNGRTDDFYAASGTSMAAPYLAGASVLVRQAMEQAGVDDVSVDLIYDTLAATAQASFDPITQQTYHHVDVAQAIASIEASNAIDEAIDEANNDSPDTNPGTNDNTEPTVVPTPLPSRSPLRFQNQQLIVTGTTGRDQIHIDQRGRVRINGESYTFDPDNVHQIVIDGQGGNDHLTLAVRRASAGVRVSPGSVEVHDAIRQISAEDIQRIDVYALADDLLAEFQGSSGRDRLTIQAEQAWMQSDTAEVYVHDAAEIQAITNDVTDTITIYDTPADDTVTVDAKSAALQSPTLSVTARGYSSYTLRATQGGFDTVSMVGDTGKDVVRARPEYLTLHSLHYSAFAQHFEARQVVGQGGQDSAKLTGSPDADHFSHADALQVFETPNSSLELNGFQHTEVLAGQGIDTAELNGSDQSDVFVAQPDAVQGIVDASLVSALGFETIRIDAHGGQDSIWVYDSLGDDIFQAAADRILAVGQNYRVQATDFEFTHATSQHGQDQGLLHYRTAADRLVAEAGKASLQNEYAWSSSRRLPT